MCVGWNFAQTLGEGTYGEVKLAVNAQTNEVVAVKIIELKKVKQSYNLIRKEVAIHKMLNHDNIIKFYGTRKEADHQYIFLAYASGGELFDRIEPDVGMPQHNAQNFFHQLIDGIEYLHSLGITHRDIKPENILLDENDILKIVDFGFATIFRHRGHERLIAKFCGTPPYVSPEVLQQTPYKAEAADIWSCGIVLVAMLAGELPWDEPSLACEEYNNWIDHKIQYSPWCKINTLPLALLRKLLTHDPESRCNIAALKKDRWFVKHLQQKRRLSSPVGSPFIKRGMTSCEDFSSNALLATEISLSQPDPGVVFNTSNVSEESVGNLLHVGLSQPVQADNMLLSTQCMGTPGSSQTALQRLGKRMTRFWTKKGVQETMAEICKACENLEYAVKQATSTELTVITSDRRLRKLIFKVFIYPSAAEFSKVTADSYHTLVDVRLSKGDGLEFKRLFDALIKRLMRIL
ncbi:serine/threonine-protein kinase Chk1-like isoform X2 [Clavelina lepadiformis]|uniref:serine/threonine-protein kinase Chk1-like isoform X2 n=1 Tax=Clavelina lepadiformis TaxID=159417 RepID=UPI00404159F0